MNLKSLTSYSQFLQVLKMEKVREELFLLNLDESLKSRVEFCRIIKQGHRTVYRMTILRAEVGGHVWIIW